MRNIRIFPAEVSRQGFNLIESAIVLAVVGLVIGGIWVAAAATNKKQVMAETASGILFIASRLDEILSPPDLVTISGGTASQDINQMAIGAGVVPGSWIRNSANMRTPSGNGFYISVAGNSSTNPRMDLGMQGQSPTAA